MTGQNRRIKKKGPVRWPTRSKLRPQLSTSQSFNRSSRRERDDSALLRNAFESVKGNNFQLAYSYQNEKLRSASLLQENVDLKKKMVDLQTENNRLKSKIGQDELSRASVKNALDAMYQRLSSSYKTAQANFTLAQQAFTNFANELDAAKDNFWDLAAQTDSSANFNSSFRSRRSSGGRAPRQRVLPMVGGMQILTMPSVRISRLNPAVVQELPSNSERESSSDSLEEVASPHAAARQRRRASRIFQPRRPVPKRQPIVSVAPRHSMIGEASPESPLNRSDPSVQDLSEVRVLVKRLSQEEIDQHSPTKSSAQEPRSSPSPRIGDISTASASDQLDFHDSQNEETAQESAIAVAVAAESETDTELVDLHETDCDLMPLPTLPRHESPISDMLERNSPTSVSGSSEPELAAIFGGRSPTPEPGVCETDGAGPDLCDRFEPELDLSGGDPDAEGVKRSSNEANLDALEELWGDFVSRPKKVSSSDPLEGTSSRYKVKKPLKPAPVISARASSRLRNLPVVEVSKASLPPPEPSYGEVAKALPEFSEPVPAPIKNPVVELKASRASARIRSKSSLASSITPEENDQSQDTKRTRSRKAISSTIEAAANDKSNGVGVKESEEQGEVGIVNSPEDEKKRSGSDKENSVRRPKKNSVRSTSVPLPKAKERTKREGVSGSKSYPTKSGATATRGRARTDAQPMQGSLMEVQQREKSLSRASVVADDCTFAKPSVLDDSLFGSPNLYDRVKKRRTSEHDSTDQNDQSDSSLRDIFAEATTRRRAASVLSFKEPSLKVKLRNQTSKK